MVRISFVSVFVTVTFAVGTVPPEVSFTVPRIAPDSCADAGMASSPKNSAIARNTTHVQRDPPILRPFIASPPAGEAASAHFFKSIQTYTPPRYKSITKINRPVPSGGKAPGRFFYEAR